jgi:hypothetical protein
MSKINIVIDENGRLESVFSNNEIDLKILKRGIDDTEVDFIEETMDELDLD